MTQPIQKNIDKVYRTITLRAADVVALILASRGLAGVDSAKVKAQLPNPVSPDWYIRIDVEVDPVVEIVDAVVAIRDERSHKRKSVREKS